MQVDNVAERVRKFLVRRFPPTRHIRKDDELLESGLLDSLGILEVVAFLEHEFQIIVTDEELLPENFHSIARLAAFVESKVNGAPVRKPEE